MPTKDQRRLEVTAGYRFFRFVGMVGSPGYGQTAVAATEAIGTTCGIPLQLTAGLACTTAWLDSAFRLEAGPRDPEYDWYRDNDHDGIDCER